MFFKLALFLAVALCASQGIQANEVDSDVYGITDIITSINDIIVKIHRAIADLVLSIPKLIGNLKEQIKEIIGSIDVWGFVDLIEDAVEDILAVAGIDASGARACIDNERAAVGQMVADANAKIESCEKDALDSAGRLHDKMNQLKRDGLDLVLSINSGTVKCTRDHLLNPFKLLKCLTNHLVEVTKKADALVIQIAETIATAAKSAAEITLTLTTCTARITADLVSKKLQIIGDFSKCVVNL